jgi:hypothetical protein
MMPLLICPSTHVQDLTSIGYKWPKVVDASSSTARHARWHKGQLPNQPPLARSQEGNNNAAAGPEDQLILQASEKAVHEYASNVNDSTPMLPRWWCKQPDIMLIVAYNSPVLFRTINLLNRAYRAMFFQVPSTMSA